MQALYKLQYSTSTIIKEFMSKFEKVDESKRTAESIQARIELLKSYWEKFSKKHEEIIVKAKNLDDEYFKDNLHEDIQEVYIDSLATLNHMLYKINEEKTEAVSVITVNQNKPEIKLPSITLPRFSGNYLEWSSFKDMFTTLIDQNTLLSNVEKLHYLKSNLSGEAELLLRNFTITSNNYDSAWKTLTERYENLQVLTKTHIEAILNTTTIQNESATDLKKLINRVSDSIRALENLERPVHHWDDWLVYIVVRKLDMNTRKDWEKTQVNNRELPSFEALRTFLLNRIRILENISSTRRVQPTVKNNFVATSNNETKVDKYKRKCSYCTSKNHNISFCNLFKNRDVAIRQKWVSDRKLCTNCLQDGHTIQNCTSTFRCRVCSDKHHTLLHSYVNNVNNNAVSTSSFLTLHRQKTVLLATALIEVQAVDGTYITYRALIDQGSQASFISSDCIQTLQLPTHNVNIPIVGIGGVTPGYAKSTVTLHCRSLIKKIFNFTCDALILKKLTISNVASYIDKQWSHLQNIELADPQYLSNHKIDIIFGADIYALILENGILKGNIGEPIAQKTTLGWIVSGELTSNNKSATNEIMNFTIQIQSDLNKQLQQFWEVEQVDIQQKVMSAEDEFCEEQFRNTHSRTTDGRYIVRLPILPDIRENIGLGESLTFAQKRLDYMQRRFKNNTALKDAYTSFMNEYIALQHMSRIEKSDFSKLDICYLPHHCVIKDTSSSTRLRVVFDGASKTSNGISLNQRLLTGPKLQLEITEVLTRWRFHRFVFTTDVEKMFRQILIHEKDQDLQRILWFDDSTGETSHYRLQTVTYGTSSAPYLAIRVLKQLAIDGEPSYPLAASTLRSSTYVDDVLGGADTVTEVKEIQRQLIGLLKAGGFKLKKWYSNNKEIINELPDEMIGTGVKFELSHENIIRALGIQWTPILDTFSFNVNMTNETNIHTKRTMLSDISKLYDPVGWLSPVIIKAKILMQRLWLCSIAWDDPLDGDLLYDWIELRRSFESISLIQIDRWFHTYSNDCKLEIHGFSDASMSAYAAVLYLKVINKNESITTSLITSKTKVAPLKTISVARLELCGAVLLSRLIRKYTALFPKAEIFAYTDSTITLAWIQSSPSRWKTFIANRVSEIQETVPSYLWNYIPSKLNPADYASRGTTPAELKIHSIWWKGPDFLQSPEKPSFENKTSSSEKQSVLAEERKHVLTNVAVQKESWSLLKRYSSLTKLFRVTAFIFRFINNCRKFDKINKKIMNLTVPEIDNAKQFWIKHVQSIHFSDELERIGKGLFVLQKSPLKTLNPFLDDNEILRVGGRLSNSSLSYSSKHPIILPKKSELSTLLIQYAHIVTLHGGIQLTLAYLRRYYWIIYGRSSVRKFIHQCVRCIRQRPVVHNQIMSELPMERVTSSRPFTHTGVDYTGPLNIKAWKGRCSRTYKAYVAVFVCLSSRAVHLELVTSLSTEDFLAALSRFTSRRGMCAHLYSDRGTNFIGANSELKLMFKSLNKNWDINIAEHLVTKGITWHFIPPYSPNFGGLWEAAVKSFKHHFRRVSYNRLLTYEEMSTLLANIESCLNSRPLCVFAEDASNPVVITPAHLLIGDTLHAVPDSNMDGKQLTCATRYKLLLQLKQHFWHYWSSEYLHSLQQRFKWTKSNKNIEIGDIVLVKERLPINHWSIAKVEEVHPGRDSIVRVVTVRCRGTLMKRSLSQICQLPIHHSTDETTIFGDTPRGAAC